MKLDQPYIDRNEAMQREIRARVKAIPGFIITQEMPEGGDFGNFLKSKGISYEVRVVDTVSTWEDLVHELHYHHPEQGERYAYVLNFHSDIDAWGQTVYLFSRAIPDEQLGDTISQLQQREKDIEHHLSERRQEIDKEFSPFWRLINYNWSMSIISYHLIMYGWTPQVETVLKQWGAYTFGLNQGTELDHPLVKSLLIYGELVLNQKEPDHYINGLLEKAGQTGHLYRGLVEMAP